MTVLNPSLRLVPVFMTSCVVTDDTGRYDYEFEHPHYKTEDNEEAYAAAIFTGPYTIDTVPRLDQLKFLNDLRTPITEIGTIAQKVAKALSDFDFYTIRVNQICALVSDWIVDDPNCELTKVCLITRDKHYRFIDVPTEMMRQFTVQLNYLNAFVRINALTDPDNINRIKQLTQEQIATIENYRIGLYGLESIYAKGKYNKKIENPFDVLWHISKEEEATKKLVPKELKEKPKELKEKLKSDFKTAYREWMEDCSARKQKLAELEFEAKVQYHDELESFVRLRIEVKAAYKAELERLDKLEAETKKNHKGHLTQIRTANAPLCSPRREDFDS